MILHSGHEELRLREVNVAVENIVNKDVVTGKIALLISAT